MRTFWLLFSFGLHCQDLITFLVTFFCNEKGEHIVIEMNLGLGFQVNFETNDKKSRLNDSQLVFLLNHKRYCLPQVHRVSKKEN